MISRTTVIMSIVGAWCLALLTLIVAMLVITPLLLDRTCTVPARAVHSPVTVYQESCSGNVP